MERDLPPAVAVVIREDDRYLLIRRAKEPFRGWWSPVTGRVEPGESFFEAAIREAEEEIGLVVVPGRVFFTCPTADGSHQLHFLPARVVGGAPRPAPDEVQDWGWFTLAECERLADFFPSDLDALRSLPA